LKRRRVRFANPPSTTSATVFAYLLFSHSFPFYLTPIYLILTSIFNQWLPFSFAATATSSLALYPVRS
jgi:hypothetical protein